VLAAQLIGSLSVNRRVKSLVEIAAFAVVVAREEEIPRTDAFRSKLPSPKAFEGHAEEEYTKVIDAGADPTSESAQNFANLPPITDAEEGVDSVFLTGGDFSPRTLPEAHPPSNERSADATATLETHRVTYAEIEAARDAEQRRERKETHVRWVKLIEKQALSWFNAVPDKDIVVSVKAIRLAKQALQARYLGWQSTLSRALPVKITVKDVRIVDMAAMDLGGTSDPYSVFKFIGTTHTTSVIYQTLRPEWKDLNYEYIVYDCSHVMSITVWDEDEGTADDIIGRCYVHVEDILKSPDHELTRQLYNDEGRDQGQFTLRVICESITTQKDLPSDEPDSCAEQAASLARVLWHLGVPRAKASFVIGVVLRAEAPTHVIKRLGDVGIISTLHACKQTWLVDIFGRWKFFTDIVSIKREQIRLANAPKLLAPQAQTWDQKLAALHKNSSKTGKNSVVNISRHINMESVPKGNREENMKFALSFCDRAVHPVDDPDKAERLVDEFQELHEQFEGTSGMDTLPLDLMAEILAKYERDARLIDQVDEEVGRVQQAVKADQGPNGVGLVPHTDKKKGMAYKWLAHKAKLEAIKKYMPLEFYLTPFIKEKCREIRDMRQTVVDMGDYFMKHDSILKREIGPVLLAISDAARKQLFEMEEQFERKRKALGKLGAEFEKKKREQQEADVATCRKWQLLHDEKVLPDVDDEMTELISHFRANLMWSMSAAVAMEREEVAARLMKLHRLEIHRWTAEEKATILAAQTARLRAEEEAAAAEALAEALAAGDAEEIARMEKEMEQFVEPVEIPKDPVPPETGDSKPPESGDEARLEKTKPDVKTASKKVVLVATADSEDSESDSDEEESSDSNSSADESTQEKKPVAAPQVSSKKPAASKGATQQKITAAATKRSETSVAKPVGAPRGPVPNPTPSGSSAKPKPKADQPKADQPKADDAAAVRPVPPVGVQKFPGRVATEEPKTLADETGKAFLNKLPESDAEDLTSKIGKAFKEQIKFSEKEKAIRTSRKEELQKKILAQKEMLKDGLAQAQAEGSAETFTRMQKEMQELESTAMYEWLTHVELEDIPLEEMAQDFGILELRGIPKMIQPSISLKSLKAGGQMSERFGDAEGNSGAGGMVRHVPAGLSSDAHAQQPPSHPQSSFMPAPVLSMPNHGRGGPMASDDLPRQVYDAIMQVKRGRTARQPIPEWKQSLMTIVTWRERVFLVWKPNEKFLQRQKEKENQPRPEDLQKQKMAAMTTDIFLNYIEGIQKTRPDDSKQRAMEKHKQRLAISHAHLMKPSRSHLPFDFVAYCVSEDTMVFQKELNRDAKFVSSFSWKRIFPVDELEQREIGISVTSHADGKLLSMCVQGGEGVVHRLFTMRVDTWHLFKVARDHARENARQAPFYYRLGETEQLDGAAVLVKSAIPYFDRNRLEEAIEIEASGLYAGAERLNLENNILNMDGSARKLSQIDIDNILNYSGFESPHQNLDRAVTQDEMIRTRGFLRTAQDDLRVLVVGEIALIQASVRRCLRWHQNRMSVEKDIHWMLHHIIDAAVFTSEISKAAYTRMVANELLEDGSLPDHTEASLLARNKIPLQRWAPSVGIDWDEIIDEAQHLREQKYANQVLAHESKRIRNIVGDAKRQLQLKCGWAGERKFVVKGLTSGHELRHDPPDPCSYPDMELTGTGKRQGVGFTQYLLNFHGERVDTDNYAWPVPPGEKPPFTALGGAQAHLHLSDKPAVANQIRLMRNRPKIIIKRKKNVQDHHDEVGGSRSGTLTGWGDGYPYSLVDPDYDLRGHGVAGSSPPRTQMRRTGTGASVGFDQPSGAGTPLDGSTSMSRGNARAHSTSRKGTAYSRVDYIDESDEDIDFLAQPSFSYASAEVEEDENEKEQEEENPFTLALKEAARNAILDRIAGMFAHTC